MIEFEELKKKVKEGEDKGMTAITLTYSISKEELEGLDGKSTVDFAEPLSTNTSYIETYKIDTEDKADELINKGRENPEFASCNKRFVPPKYNKAGELVKGNYYIVQIGYKVR